MWINQIYGYFYSIGFCEYINIRNSILGLEKSDFSKKHTDPSNFTPYAYRYTWNTLRFPSEPIMQLGLNSNLTQN